MSKAREMFEALKLSFQLEYYKSINKLYAFYNFNDVEKVGKLFGNFFEDIEEENCAFKNGYLVIIIDIYMLMEYFEIENQEKFIKEIGVA